MKIFTYEDHFENESRLIAISKQGRSMDSEDVQNFLFAKQRGIKIELFVRKNKDDKISKEFYYLGRMRASERAREFIMKTIKVVAAVIADDMKAPTRIFATARGYGEFKGGWEFPGGKIEPGETPEEALVREIKEELDTVIEVGEKIDTVEYDYPEFYAVI